MRCEICGVATAGPLPDGFDFECPHSNRENGWPSVRNPAGASMSALCKEDKEQLNRIEAMLQELTAPKRRGARFVLDTHRKAKCPRCGNPDGKYHRDVCKGPPGPMRA